eukprot:4183868-Pyramimonas_sp.AAC.1
MGSRNPFGNPFQRHFSSPVLPGVRPLYITTLCPPLYIHDGDAAHSHQPPQNRPPSQGGWGPADPRNISHPNCKPASPTARKLLLSRGGHG